MVVLVTVSTEMNRLLLLLLLLGNQAVVMMLMHLLLVMRSHGSCGSNGLLQLVRMNQTGYELMMVVRIYSRLLLLLLVGMLHRALNRKLMVRSWCQWRRRKTLVQVLLHQLRRWNCSTSVQT